ALPAPPARRARGARSARSAGARLRPRCRGDLAARAHRPWTKRGRAAGVPDLAAPPGSPPEQAPPGGSADRRLGRRAATRGRRGGGELVPALPAGRARLAGTTAGALA